MDSNLKLFVEFEIANWYSL